MRREAAVCMPLMLLWCCVVRAADGDLGGRVRAPGRSISQGDALLEAGQVSEAVAAFSKAVEAHPGNHLARRRLAGALLRLRPPQVGKAIENLRVIEEADPTDRRARFLLAKAFGMKGQFEAAILRYEHLVFAEPGVWQLRLNLGQLYSRAGKRLPAQREFALLLRERPRLNEAYNSLGNLYNSISSSLEALECFERAAELAPDNFMGIYNLGLLLANLGREDEAESHLGEVLDLNPSFPHAHFQLGLIEEDRADEATARDHYMVALKDRAVRPHALTRLAMQLIARGQTENAVQLLTTAARYNVRDIYPWEDSARYLLADLLLKDGKEQDAVASLEQAVRYNPGAHKAMKKLAQIYEEAGDVDRADDYARRAKTMAAAVSVKKQARDHFKAAFAAFRDSQKERARVEAAASNMAQENLDALLLLARLDLEADKLDEAERWASAASSLQPLSGMARAYRGLVLDRQGRNEEAFKVLSDAARVRPYDLAVNLALGRVALRLEKHREAIRALQMALALDHESKEAASGLVAAYRAIGKPDGEKLVEEEVAVQARKAGAARTELARRTAVAQKLKERVEEEHGTAGRGAAKAQDK